MNAVTDAWVACIPQCEIAALDPFRLNASLELCEEEDFIWVRARTNDAASSEVLRCVPWTGIYDLLPGNTLRKRGHAVPERRLPGGNWTTLSAALGVTLPPTKAAGTVLSRVALRLVSGGEWKSPNLLCTTVEHWLEFIDTASAARLKRLNFAQTGNEIFVRGLPLPPIAGIHLVEEEGIARPVGTRFSPNVPSTTIRKVVGSGAGEMVVWLSETRILCVPAEAWLPASRALVRSMNPAS